LYKNAAMGIEGACGPVLIHCDATQTEEKKMEERERQRNGETPTEANVANKFLNGLDLPDGLVRTSKSGSMTQEIFYDYCQHFCGSLPEHHEPVILFLDGHASRWNTQALKYLHDNNVFLFFFASHTSIWAQPNDCGLNKRVHWAIEKACKQYRRSGRTTCQGYFNSIFSLGWTFFLKAEAADLLECFDNNATRAYERTGVFPLNPFSEAWSDAIDGLGSANHECRTRSYEIVPSEEKMPVLSPAEKSILRTNLDLDDKNDLGDFYAAEIQATKILGKWWCDVEKGVSEGADKEEHSALRLPSSFATTEVEKLVMRLIAFEPVDVSKIPLSAPISEEERAKEITKTIVFLTQISQPIHISYVVNDSDSESTDDTGSLNSSDSSYSIQGTAIKQTNATWGVTLSNGDVLTLTSDQMLTSPNIFVQNAYLDLDSTERNRTISKKKRIRNSEKKKKEKQYIRLAQVKAKEEEKKEYDKMMEKIGDGEFEFSEFQKLVARMRAPFSCEIDGVGIQVTPDDAAVMFNNAALKAMKRVLVIGNNSEQQDGGPPKKKRRNTAAAETGLGLGCNKAHYETDRRDRSQNESAKATKLKQDLKEKDVVTDILTCFDKRLKQYMVGVKQWQEKGAAPGSRGPCPHIPFWICRESDNKEFRLFLRMFLPKYGHGYLGKCVGDQWACILANIIGKLDLTRISVCARAEELRRRLRTLQQSIQDAQTVEINDEPI
jgi:hypothetical protein